MSVLFHRRIYAGLCLVCLGCSEPAPSAPSLASVAGTFELTVARCGLPGEVAGQVDAFLPPHGLFVSSVRSPWTLSQSGSEVSGGTSGSVPPFSWGGTLTGRVTNASRIEISGLSYRDSSSHGGIQTLSGAGEAFIEPAGIFGNLTGDYTFTPTFAGVFAGSPSTCHGVQMPMRFSPR